MSIALGLWIAAAPIIGLVWLVRFIFMGMMLRRGDILGSHSYQADTNEQNTPWGADAAPRLSVFVAAKDEQDNIEACVTSLLDQDYPNFEVIVIDDRSRDRTPGILRDLKNTAKQPSNPASGDARAGLRVVTLQDLPDGWFGKSHAMHEGVSLSSSDWFVFTDADCRQTSRRTLSVAMSEVLSKDVDFLSIIPVLETKTAWERVLQPACAFMLILWFLPHRTNDPARKTAYANGAFMLIRKSCYDAIGGHERVRGEVNEDVKLAQNAKRMGFKLRVVENDDLYRTRMYATPSEAWRGWTRIFYGSLGTLRRLRISVLMILTYTILPWASLAVSLFVLYRPGTASNQLWSLAAGAWMGVLMLHHLTLWRYYGMLRIGRLWSLAYLPGAVVTLAMLFSSMLKVIGVTGTTWRGTTYSASPAAKTVGVEDRLPYNQRDKVHHLADGESN